MPPPSPRLQVEDSPLGRERLAYERELAAWEAACLSYDHEMHAYSALRAAEAAYRDKWRALLVMRSLDLPELPKQRIVQLVRAA